jgi:hypothetical protein
MVPVALAKVTPCAKIVQQLGSLAVTKPLVVTLTWDEMLTGLMLVGIYATTRTLR